MALPLIARGRDHGHCRVAPPRRLPAVHPADLALARDLAARALAAIDNARRCTRERATAGQPQAGLLPRAIPGAPGLDLARRHAPALAAAKAGGDWLDVIPLPRGRCALTARHVTGHDIRAAAVALPAGSG